MISDVDTSLGGPEHRAADCGNRSTGGMAWKTGAAPSGEGLRPRKCRWALEVSGQKARWKLSRIKDINTEVQDFQ